MRFIIILITILIFISCGENETSCLEECQINASCNSEGNCECDDGYTLVGDICKDNLHLCDDITCQVHSSCEESTGVCICDIGYTLNNGKCEENSQNLCDSVNCVVHSTCNEDNGNCECDNGYTLNNGECEENSQNLCDGKICQNHSTCNENNGNCECDNNYTLNNGKCEENSQNPCDSVNCVVHSTCNEDNGICECDNNYILDGDICRIENGTKLNPFMISTFPYNHNGNTETSNERNYDNYNCSEANESGAEEFYKFTITKIGKINIEVIVGSGVDVDIYLLEDLDNQQCIERNDKKINSYLLPGTYYIVVDTYVNGSSVEKKGAYQLKVNYTENGTDDFWATRKPIPGYIFDQMNNVSYKPGIGCTEPKDLRYIFVMHKNLEGNATLGELIVHKDVANDIIDNFKIMYDTNFKVEKIVLISDSDYNASDDRSMEDNNTSAYNCRLKTNGTTLSNHSFGKAIDINPKFNPYVSGNTVEPYNATRWKDRTLNDPGMIKKNDTVYNSFHSKGWIWGGDWNSIKDYQHFEKN